MERKLRFFLMVIILGFFYSCTGKLRKAEKVPFARMSKTIEDSKRKALFQEVYDLHLIYLEDTLVFERFAWLEKVWFDTINRNGHADIRIASNNQLVFPYEKSFNRLSLSKKKVDIVDENWNYLARMGINYSYKLEDNSIPNSIILFTENRSKRVKQMIFEKSVDDMLE